MRRMPATRIILSAATIIAVLLVTVAAFAVDLEPYTSSGTKVEPVIAGLQPVQMGGDTLLLRMRGHSMPRPVVLGESGEGKLILFWDGARFPQATEKRDWWDNYEWDVLALKSERSDTWWKQYDLPLLERIDVEPTEDGSLKMTLTSSQELVLSDVIGVAGADTLSVMLKVKPAQKTIPVQRPTPVMSARDPMNIKAPVTLQLRDADVKGVFRMLAEQQKLDLMLDPSVPDMNVTFSFKKVPFCDAFSYLLRMTDLSYSMVDDMLVVGRAESIGRTLGKEVLRGYKLSYAIDGNGNLRGDLTASLTGLIKLSTAPTVDARTRTMYIKATPEQHREIEELLERLDHPGKQIMIQARIIEVNDDGREELETLVAAVYDKWLMNFSSAGTAIGYNTSNVPFEGVDLDYPVAGRLPGSTETLGDIMLDSGMRMLSAGLRAIETKGKGKVLANPSVITLDGEEARVELTRDFRYASGVDANGNTNFSTVESGPRLTFTPVIGRNGMITVKLHIETGDVVAFRSQGNGAVAPETTSRRVDTTIRVRDGEPFAVGGLFMESKTKERRRIPILGSIPLLGDLFTTRTDQHVKSEVAMIVIPYILDIPETNISTFDLSERSLAQ